MNVIDWLSKFWLLDMSVLVYRAKTGRLLFEGLQNRYDDLSSLAYCKVESSCARY